MFRARWVPTAAAQYEKLRRAAEKAFESRRKSGRKKSSRQEGLFRQVQKTIDLLLEDPRHPGLQTHEYRSLPNPINPREKVFEAYAQHKTPAAYRVFWCYGPRRREITVIAITPHP